MSDSLEIEAYTCCEYGMPLELKTYTASPLLANQVQCKILSCGICASDYDLLQAKYGPEMTAAAGYPVPLVAGHEGVGEVTVVGSLVKNLQVGDVVGLGVSRSCCGACNMCANGKTNLCPKKALMFAQGEKGCFSKAIRINSNFAFKIPDGIPVDKAGPLMCAGLTTFAPFKEHNIRPGQTVGVLGIGGLGHLALQFGRAFGCRVIALTRGTSKEKEAKSLGANIVVDTTDEESKKSVLGKIDYLLVTAGGPSTDVGELLNMLSPGGKLILMGFIAASLNIPLMPLIGGQKSVVGSAAGSNAVMIEMLDFAALHGIAPMTEEFPFSRINEAITHVKSGAVRYRAVLKW